MIRQKKELLLSTSVLVLNSVIEFIYNKSLLVFLNKLYGVKKFKINRFFFKVGFSSYILIKHLPNTKFKFICSFFNDEGKAKISFSIDKNIKHNLLKDLNLLKGKLLSRGLPLYGQRTHSNKKTSKYLFKKSNEDLKDKNVK